MTHLTCWSRVTARYPLDQTVRGQVTAKKNQIRAFLMYLEGYPEWCGDYRRQKQKQSPTRSSRALVLTHSTWNGHTVALAWLSCHELSQKQHIKNECVSTLRGHESTIYAQSSFSDCQQCWDVSQHSASIMPEPVSAQSSPSLSVQAPNWA